MRRILLLFFTISVYGANVFGQSTESVDVSFELGNKRVINSCVGTGFCTMKIAENVTQEESHEYPYEGRFFIDDKSNIYFEFYAETIPEEVKNVQLKDNTFEVSTAILIPLDITEKLYGNDTLIVIHGGEYPLLKTEDGYKIKL